MIDVLTFDRRFPKIYSVQRALTVTLMMVNVTKRPPQQNVQSFRITIIGACIVETVQIKQ